MERSLTDRDRWDQRYAAGSHSGSGEPEWLAECGVPLPQQGRALDVASGTGPAARWLARQGLDVLAIDVSPVGLALAEERAREAGLAITTRAVDLETEPLPPGPWDVIVCLHYLNRDLFPALCRALAPGGIFVCEIATVRNLERHDRPPRRFLLEEGELATLVDPLEIVHYREGWLGASCVARVVARRV